MRGADKLARFRLGSVDVFGYVAAMMTRLEHLQQFLAGTLPPDAKPPVQIPAPIMRLLGMELTAIGRGSSTMTLQTDPERQGNPMGTLHGGVLCDLGDAAIGMAHAASLAEGESFTSIDLKINFFRPVWRDTLTATATALQLGRNVSFYECVITNTQGKLVAKLASSVMTLRGDAAKNR